MEYCAPLGIPHSVFQGRVVGPTDPQWSQYDRDVLMAYRNRKSEQCPDCKTWEDEWEENRDAYIGDDRICQGCVVLHRESENDPNPKGTPGRKIGLTVNNEEAEELEYDESHQIDTLEDVIARRREAELPNTK